VGSLRFNLLGPLEVVRDGSVVELGARKQRAVLALLLLDANRIVSTERLIDGLWGDAPPETARSALQVYVAGLRKALGEDGGSLRTSAPGYVLDVPSGASDLEEFGRLRAEGRPRDALALWRGVALADLDGEPFSAAAAGRLEELRLATLEEAIESDLARGRHVELVPELDGIVAEHPFRERFRAQQMVALYRSGRQADALAAYRSARTAFVDELGIEPGEELKRIERAVLDHDPELAAPASPAAAVGPGRRKRRLRVVAAAVPVVALLAAAAVVLLGSDATPVSVEPNSLAIIDPEQNEVVGTVPVGTLPGPVTAGGGFVWAANLDGKSVTQVDPSSRKVVETISLQATPTGIAFGHDHVWTAHGLTGQVTRIDPELGGQDTFEVAETRRRSPDGAVASGPSGIWAVFGDGTMARVDPVSGSADGGVVQALNRPAAVIEAAGMVWVVSSGDSTVYRFDPTTFLAGPLGDTGVGRRSSAIAYGFGAGWVASSGDDLVMRVHASTNSAVPVTVGQEPVAVAAGAGAVWAANGGDGTVSRIDPETRAVVETIEVGNRPAGIVVAHGLVWVTVQSR
jgi:YVTN family beta-propeller protein